MYETEKDKIIKRVAAKLILNLTLPISGAWTSAAFVDSPLDGFQRTAGGVAVFFFNKKKRGKI